MADDMRTTPCRPYLVRALYDWILDNELTPQITVNVNCPNVELPLQYAQNGVIVLNISPVAVRDLVMDNDGLSFGARFSGVSHEVYIPMYAVTAIYPRERPDLGMCLFPEQAYDEMFSSEAKPKSKLSAVDDTETKTSPLEVVESSNATGEAKTETEAKPDNATRKKPTFEIVE